MNFYTFLDGFHSSRIALPPEESTLYVMDAFSGACLSGKLKENFGKSSLSTTTLFFTVNYCNQTVNLSQVCRSAFLPQLILCDEKSCRGWWFPPPGWRKNSGTEVWPTWFAKESPGGDTFPSGTAVGGEWEPHLSPQVCVSTKFVRNKNPTGKESNRFQQRNARVMSWCPEFAKLATGSGNQTYTVDGWNL